MIIIWINRTSNEYKVIKIFTLRFVTPDTLAKDNAVIKHHHYSYKKQ